MRHRAVQIVEGLMLAGGVYPILRVDDGGEWRLDLPAKFHKLIGRRARVEGFRSEFDVLDVTKADAL